MNFTTRTLFICILLFGLGHNFYGQDSTMFTGHWKIEKMYVPDLGKTLSLKDLEEMGGKELSSLSLFFKCPLTPPCEVKEYYVWEETIYRTKRKGLIIDLSTTEVTIDWVTAMIAEGEGIVESKHYIQIFTYEIGEDQLILTTKENEKIYYERK